MDHLAPSHYSVPSLDIKEREGKKSKSKKTKEKITKGSGQGILTYDGVRPSPFGQNLVGSLQMKQAHIQKKKKKRNWKKHLRRLIPAP